MNKIIVLGNNKGGVGKSTTAMLLALYLKEKGYNVRVVDGDVQHTIAKAREDELAETKGSIDGLYQVVSTEPSKADETLDVIVEAESFDGVVIYDTPGDIGRAALDYAFRHADAVIVPYRYDENTINSTIGFCIYLQHLREDYKDFVAQLYFLPNNMPWNWGTAAEKAIRTELDREFFSKYGTILQPLPMRKCFQNLSTISLTKEQKTVLGGYFDILRMNVIDN